MHGWMEERVGWSIGEWKERVVMNEVVEESQDGKVQEEEPLHLAWKRECEA